MEKSRSMRIGVAGAAGNTGRRIVDLALECGHQVTAIVRDVSRIQNADRANLLVQVVSFEDEAALARAMQGLDVVINAAGNSNDGPAYAPLVQRIIRAADVALGPGGRFWLFGGAAVLDIPGTEDLTLDLPRIPRIFEAHRENPLAVRSTSLDWSMLCPGPMIDAPCSKPTDGLRLSSDTWPVPRPGVTKALPRIFTSLAFRQTMPQLTIYYEDAARVILDYLERGGPFVRKRVGIALPPGEKRHKDYVPD